MQQPSNSNLPELPEYYQTGSTKPPKSHNSIIAVLLVLVILLSGIVSVMGLMNIHLFRALMNQKEEAAAMAFESAPSGEVSLANYALDATQAVFHGGAAIGILGQDITGFYESFYGVPQGVYVSDIDNASDAYDQGLRTRDIILAFNGARVTDCAGLRKHLENVAPGEKARLRVYRKGMQFEMIVTLQEDAG